MCFASMERAQLDGAFMPNAVMRMVNLRDAKFGRTRLYRHNLEQRPGELWPAQLQDADFKGADIRHAQFDCSVLARTNFLGAKVDASRFTRCKMAEPTGALLARRGANVVAPRLI